MCCIVITAETLVRIKGKEIICVCFGVGIFFFFFNQKTPLIVNVSDVSNLVY